MTDREGAIASEFTLTHTLTLTLTPAETFSASFLSFFYLSFSLFLSFFFFCLYFLFFIFQWMEPLAIANKAIIRWLGAIGNDWRSGDRRWR